MSTFSIDRLRLEEECEKQVDFMEDHCTILANAKKEVGEAEAELELVDAELAMAIRRKPKKFGLERVTDQAIKQAILLQKEHIDAEQAVIKAKHLRDLAQGAVNTLDNRREMISDLVKLHGQGYFAAPSVPQEVSESVRDIVRKKNRVALDGKRRKKK